MKISLPAPELSQQRLESYRRMGVQVVTVPRRLRTEATQRPIKPLVPPAATGETTSQAPPPDPQELARIVARCCEFGLEPGSIDWGLSTAILSGEPRREQDLSLFNESVRIIGASGIGVITLNFTRLRASEGYRLAPGAGRGGADLRDFDATRIDGLPPLPAVGEHDEAAMWDRLIWFLEGAVPVAASAGVRFAMHPNDPPVPSFRGVAQPLHNLAAMQRLVQAVDDPANGIFLDTGVATEWGEDAVAVVDWFARRDRVSLAHVRNVQVDEPMRRYAETFVDAGDADIGACLRCLADCGYKGGIDPDHTPRFTVDGSDLAIGWSWALGALAGWRDAAVG
ncbi:MAG: TIM barrel protein [Gemmatimonadetes bacterium]|nr:TIM barrel protein [Gemmatimonadota bacterium]MBT6147079.1 TIM barrel protein [Gemmatimonadota bacterium]MBT7863583.1 TIM barrel protein [Gemmatimonadota bacterium]